jgi:hypothetical protein
MRFSFVLTVTITALVVCAAPRVVGAQGVAGRDYLYADDGSKLYIRATAPPEVWTLLDNCEKVETIGLQGQNNGRPPFRLWEIPPDGFARISGCSQLEILSFTGAVALAPSGLAAIEKLTSLRILEAPDTVLNDASAQHVANLHGLEQIWLDGRRRSETTSGSRAGDRTFAAFAAMSRLRELRAMHTVVTAAGIAAVGGLETLQYLDLYQSTGVGDDALETIGSLTALETLLLGHTRVSNAGMEHLAELRNLRTLDLQHTNVSDTGMRALAGLGLTWIGLQGTRVGSEGFAHLRGMTALTNVYASDTLLDDRAIPIFLQMPKLAHLHISGTRITDAGLRALDALPELEWLEINDLPMTDETAAILAAIPKLGMIEMNRTLVTPAGEAALAAGGAKRINVQTTPRLLE